MLNNIKGVLMNKTFKLLTLFCLAGLSLSSCESTNIFDSMSFLNSNKEIETSNEQNEQKNNDDAVEKDSFRIMWQNWDGFVLEIDHQVPYGTIPSYDGATPTRENDDSYSYTWSGWSPEISPVTKDQIYTAVYSKGDLVIEEQPWEVSHGITPTFSSNNKKITYGLYPQKFISDEQLISNLNSLVTAEENGWFLFKNDYYAKVKAEPFYNNTFDDGSLIKNNETYWFKCEPIVWRVLSKDHFNYFLLSDLVLDCLEYYETNYETPREINGETIYHNNYEYSDIRDWLNNDFYNSAFSLSKTNNRTTIVRNKASTTDSNSNIYACKTTLDKVSILSYQDYINSDYEFTTSPNESENRICKSTDYSRARGLLSSKESGKKNGSSSYWSRSPYSENQYRSWRINPSGKLDLFDTGSKGGIRPCITIKISDNVKPITDDCIRVTWKDYDDDILYFEEEFNVPYKPSFDGALPYREDDDQYSYFWTGWSPEINEINEDTTFTSTYCAFKKNETNNPIVSEDGTKIQYGYYPQRHVSDKSLWNTLSSVSDILTNGWVRYENKYYFKANTNAYYGTIFDNKEQIKYSEYWFECEPIVWDILSKNEDTYFVESSKLLDTKQYCTFSEDEREIDGKTIYKNNYQYSYIREWLNDEFYNKAFYLNDSSIQITLVDNSGKDLSSNENQYRCDDTNDKIFLLSYLDYRNEDYGFVNEKSRQCLTTDFSRANRASNISNYGDYRLLGSYWTRTPSYNYNSYAYCVSKGGAFESYYTTNNGYCVRPAMNIKIN